MNLAVLLAITQFELKKIHQEKSELEKEGGGWHDHISSYTVTLRLDRIFLYMSLNVSLI